jgi:hypothetical protein
MSFPFLLLMRWSSGNSRTNAFAFPILSAQPALVAGPSMPDGRSLIAGSLTVSHNGERLRWLVIDGCIVVEWYYLLVARLCASGRVALAVTRQGSHRPVRARIRAYGSSTDRLAIHEWSTRLSDRVTGTC